MTLPLITPIGSNFLKDWPSQNAINCNLFDAAAGACLATHSLNSYTPVWTASTTDPFIGTGGKQIGYYYLVFDMVYVYVEVRLGSGALRGAGFYAVSLPFKPKTLITRTGGYVIGNGQAYSDGTPAQRQPLLVTYNSGNVVRFPIKMGSSTTRLLTESVPFLYSVQDGIMFCARYQRDLS